MSDDMSQLKAQLTELKNGMKVTQITASRVIKTRGGDVFLSMSANMPKHDEDEGGIDLKSARLASHVLGLELSILAHEQACANGLITGSELEMATKAVKGNYTKLLVEKGKP